jgi:hypothetical protein
MRATSEHRALFPALRASRNDSLIAQFTEVAHATRGKSGGKKGTRIAVVFLIGTPIIL